MTFNINLERDEDGVLDDDAIYGYIEQLSELFSKSAEGQQVIAEQGGIRWIFMFLEYAIDYLDVLPPEMESLDIEELLFQIFPEKVSAPAEDAPQIIREIRAFWQFLAREYQLKNAEECLSVVTEKAIIKFTKLMADSRNYGMAKSMVMEGFAQGYDMTDEDQVNKWMIEYNQKMMGETSPKGSPFPSLPSFFNFFNKPSFSEPSDMSVPTFSTGGGHGKTKADKAKKAKRKMKQASQKRNRKHK